MQLTEAWFFKEIFVGPQIDLKEKFSFYKKKKYKRQEQKTVKIPS